jgi:hypothetical protein
MSRQTPHGANKGDHIAARGRNLVSRIRKGHEGTPAYRKFNGQVFRLETIQPSIREANWWIEEYKEHFFIRKVKTSTGYAVYVREKTKRRGQ